MEGVTEPCFRELILARNEPAFLGGTFTEFVRVVHRPVPPARIREALGSTASPQPVGVQLMGPDPISLAETARNAVLAGAPLVDLNFGCPSKGALRGCAGSALLDDPPRIEAIVRSVVEAVAGHPGGVPVTAKVRAGGEDDARLEEIAAAVEAGGAELLTVHCRTRREAYRPTADWDRLRRAVQAVSIPVCGNGGVEEHNDLARLISETGCRYAMVGRAALGDPWVFGGRDVGPGEAASFLLEYAERLRATGARAPRAAGRVKQLLRYWCAGGLVGDSTGLESEGTRPLLERNRLLGEKDPEVLFQLLIEVRENARQDAR